MNSFPHDGSIYDFYPDYIGKKFKKIELNQIEISNNNFYLNTKESF